MEEYRLILTGGRPLRHRPRPHSPRGEACKPAPQKAYKPSCGGGTAWFSTKHVDKRVHILYIQTLSSAQATEIIAVPNLTPTYLPCLSVSYRNSATAWRIRRTATAAILHRYYDQPGRVMMSWTKRCLRAHCSRAAMKELRARLNFSFLQPF